MSANVDVSLILTAHREGLLAGVSAQSLLLAYDAAVQNGISCEIIVILDNADTLTRDILVDVFQSRARIFETQLGDPGLARNYGISQATGKFSTFLDGDDLWSKNWITYATKAARQKPEAVFHSYCNIFFGTSNGVWWHVDSESALCDPVYLRWTNYWDALTLAKTEIYKQHPFRKNSVKDGFGHEDWHWNIVTLSANVHHKPVPGTVHFKRRRGGTQSGLVDKVRGVPFPEPDAVLKNDAFEDLLASLQAT